jgi:DNA invertase Pin-like site-specific DNA recombinase
VKYGYARVSTFEQNMDLQMDVLAQAGCEKIFTDHGKSGASDDRSGLTEAIEALGDGDSLTVWRLDRLGRSLRSLIDILATVEAKGTEFASISDGIDTRTSGGKLYFHMMGALAQFEHDLTLVNRECIMPNREIVLGNRDFNRKHPVIVHLSWNDWGRSPSTRRIIL